MWHTKDADSREIEAAAIEHEALRVARLKFLEPTTTVASVDAYLVGAFAIAQATRTGPGLTWLEYAALVQL